MPTKYKTMFETFCEMFPNYKDKVIKVEQAKNGAGILIVLDSNIELQFSYLDNKTWWLRTM